MFRQVGNGALIPLEVCEVPPGQIMRKQVPPEKTKDVLDFATKRPSARLDSIRNGLEVTGSATLIRFPKFLKRSPDPEVERVGICQAVWPQGGAERATATAPGSCVNASHTQVRSELKTSDNRACGYLLFQSPSNCRSTQVPRDGAWNMWVPIAFVLYLLLISLTGSTRSFTGRQLFNPSPLWSSSVGKGSTRTMRGRWARICLMLAVKLESSCRTRTQAFSSRMGRMVLSA